MGIVLALAAASPRPASAAGEDPPLPPSAWQTHGIPLSAEEADWLRAHPRVRLVGDPAWPPCSFVDAQGRYHGSDLDVVRLAGRRLGLTFEEVPATSWEDALRKLYAGEADVAGGTTASLDRIEHLLFSAPYFDFPVAIISRQEAPFYLSLETLPHGTVAVPRDYLTTQSLLQNHPELSVQLTRTSGEALERVARGDADATVENLIVASYYLRQHTLANLKIVGFAPDRFLLSIGTRRELPLLASAMNKALASIKPEERAAIYRRWVSGDYTPGGVRWQRAALWAAAVLGVAGTAVGFVLWHNRSLTRELTERRRVEADLRAARDRLAHLNAEKSRFMGMAAHDLNNPLTAILMSAQVIVRRERGLSETAVGMLQAVHGHAQRMHRLIRNLLDANTIEQGMARFRPEALDLGEVAAAVVNSFELSAVAKGITLRGPASPPPAPIHADRDALTQVLENLLSNALKFTTPGGVVEVAVDVPGDGDAGGRARVMVCDDGPGIGPEDRERLFQPFQRLSARPTGDESSHGLGLFITKRVTEELGGTIACCSGPLRGACFVVEFPLATAA